MLASSGGRARHGSFAASEQFHSARSTPEVSVLFARMLDEARRHHGAPSSEDLAAHFATELIRESRGERIAHSLELYWDEQYDDSAHVLVPRLESIIRDLARASGLVVVKPAGEARFAGFISLGTALRKLQEPTPNPWFDYLDALLCDPLAYNLRNEIAHGINGRRWSYWSCPSDPRGLPPRPTSPAGRGGDNRLEPRARRLWSGVALLQATHSESGGDGENDGNNVVLVARSVSAVQPLLPLSPCRRSALRWRFRLCLHRR